jgi:hypothetical protein
MSTQFKTFLFSVVLRWSESNQVRELHIVSTQDFETAITVIIDDIRERYPDPAHWGSILEVTEAQYAAIKAEIEFEKAQLALLN